MDIFEARSTLERDKMQRQYSIEVRVPSLEPEEFESLSKEMKALGKRALKHATRIVGKKREQPKMAIYSDDFFYGPQDLTEE
jgi:hypothetical protein